jgi:acyl carrier protein
MDDHLHETLSEYLANEVFKQPQKKIGKDEALISSGLIDSFSLVDLALYIEDNFGVRIDDTELNAETFDTLDQLCALIRAKQL